ncbi:PepSY domain-containing protein [Azospirillum sp. B4]|uniref:PepSY domain-containing protein n=1 Tax=Azospirillum sp. B4 TaxID=95605 RepID=UPI0003462F7E|nr:PepSY domain-containing protein [Azospirillum sp. B4]
MNRFAALMTAAVVLAGAAAPAFADEAMVSSSDARKAVQAYLQEHDKANLRVGSATRKDEYYNVTVSTAEGIPVKAFHVDATSGKVLDR